MHLDIEVEAEFLASVLKKYSYIDNSLLKSVEPDYFSVDSYKWFVKLLIERDWEPVPKGLVDQELSSITDEDSRSKYKIQISSLYDREITFQKDAHKKFRAFVAYRKVNAAVTASFEGYNRTGRIDLLTDELESSAVEAKSIISESELEVHDFADDYDARQEMRRSIRDNPSLNPRVLTGIRGLDEQFIIKAPMLVEFIAPFKRFKSIILNALGYAGSLQGFNCVHVTYENSYGLTSDRYDSMFSGLNFNRISNMIITQEEKDNLDRMFEWIKSWSNRLKIIKCKSRETTVKEVEDRIKRLEDTNNFSPDFEIWDYLNIIAPSKRYREERHDQAQAVWDLKGHADKYNVAIFTAGQTNMGGVSADRLELEHRGKAIDISQGLDISIAIDQTKQEKQEGILVLSPQFVRSGEIKIPHVVLDTDIPRMQIDPSMYRLWEHAQRVNPYIKK